MIQKVRKRMKRKKRVSVRKLAGELDISNGSVARILKQDLGYRSYKKRVEPALTDFEKNKRMKGYALHLIYTMYHSDLCICSTLVLHCSFR